MAGLCSKTSLSQTLSSKGSPGTVGRQRLPKVKISISDAHFSAEQTIVDFFNRIRQKQSFTTFIIKPIRAVAVANKKLKSHD
jgi:hypothetical protein